MEKQSHSSNLSPLGPQQCLPFLYAPRTPGRLYKNKENPTRESFNLSTKRTVMGETVPVQSMMFRPKGKDRGSKPVLSKHGRQDGAEGKVPCPSFQSERNFHCQEQNLPSYTFQKISPSTIQTHSQTPFSQRTSSTFKLYSPNKLNPSKKVLPTLSKPKAVLEHQQESDKKSEVKPSDLGAYSEKRNIEAFLRRFKQVLQRNFIEGPNIENEEELYKVEFYLLKEIHSEGKWLD